MENDKTISIDEVDPLGGWLVTHWTRTWDTRVSLKNVDDQLQQALATLVVAQTEVDKIRDKKVTFETEIRAAKDKDTSPMATSTPIV